MTEFHEIRSISIREPTFHRIISISYVCLKLLVTVDFLAKSGFGQGSVLNHTWYNSELQHQPNLPRNVFKSHDYRAISKFEPTVKYFDGQKVIS